MKIPEIHDLQDIQGWMSPVSKVTLPPFEKGKLGIHKDAMYYSYIHPPENLAQKIIWKDVIWKDVERNQEDKKRKGEECTIIENHWAKEYCSILGAYAYFGKDKKLLQVNAISLKKTDYYVQLVGPFKPTKEGAANMRERDRVHPLTLEVFHECSYVAIGFSIAGETFRSKPICNGSTNGRHGAFIFYRDNGTALTYEIDDGQNYFNPAGKISSLQDAFAQTAKDNMEFVNDNFLPAVGADERFKKDVLRVLENKKKKDNNETLKKELKEIMNGLKYEIADGSEDGKKNMRKKNILHYACRAKCGKEAIEKLVGLWSTSILTQKDSIGWLPLHFACRYCAKDKDLIEYLIEQIEPYMIGLKELMSDDFNRWPLHVAINSKPSVAVIELLLKNETNTKVMEIKTKNLERYPIHIACNRGVDKIIFQKLLDSIKHMREMMNFKTVLGSTPLQLAIERGLESDIIDLLITKCNCKGSSSVHEFECTCISSLYSRYNGMVSDNDFDITPF
jgi:ankyrin repeat protein